MTLRRQCFGLRRLALRRAGYINSTPFIALFRIIKHYFGHSFHKALCQDADAVRWLSLCELKPCFLKISCRGARVQR